MVEDYVLIVDDEPFVINSIRRVLIDAGYMIFSAENAYKGLEILKAHPIKVVISDEMMPGMSGSEFLSRVRQQFPNVIRIMLTGQASIEAAMRAVNEGEIYRFFTKPWNDLDLRFAVQAGIDKYDLEERNKKLLEIVKRQELDLKMLENRFPGITILSHDEEGRIVLPDISQEEMSQIIAQCECDRPLE
jgi:two-component system, probable response regulator PhcQ